MSWLIRECIYRAIHAFIHSFTHSLTCIIELFLGLRFFLICGRLLSCKIIYYLSVSCRLFFSVLYSTHRLIVENDLVSFLLLFLSLSLFSPSLNFHLVV